MSHEDLEPSEVYCYIYVKKDASGERKERYILFFWCPKENNMNYENDIKQILMSSLDTTWTDTDLLEEQICKIQKETMLKILVERLYNNNNQVVTWVSSGTGMVAEEGMVREVKVKVQIFLGKQREFRVIMVLTNSANINFQNNYDSYTEYVALAHRDNLIGYLDEDDRVCLAGRDEVKEREVLDKWSKWMGAKKKKNKKRWRKMKKRWKLKGKLKQLAERCFFVEVAPGEKEADDEVADEDEAEGLL